MLIGVVTLKFHLLVVPDGATPVPSGVFLLRIIAFVPLILMLMPLLPAASISRLSAGLSCGSKNSACLYASEKPPQRKAIIAIVTNAAMPATTRTQVRLRNSASSQQPISITGTRVRKVSDIKN